MRSSRISALWRPNSGIALGEVGAGSRAIRVVGGPGWVLTAGRRAGGRPFTYDTALAEEVFVELPDAPQPTDDWQALRWTRIGYHMGNIGVLFVSLSGAGEVRVRTARTLIDRLLGRRRVEVELNLTFQEPIVDAADRKQVTVHWRFALDAPA